MSLKYITICRYSPSGSYIPCKWEKTEANNATCELQLAIGFIDVHINNYTALSVELLDDVRKSTPYSTFSL